MKATKKTRIPSLRHCNNRGFVCLNGKRIYLGSWGEQSTQEAYERIIGEFLCIPIHSSDITLWLPYTRSPIWILSISSCSCIYLCFMWCISSQRK